MKQRKDHYFRKAKKEGFRARSAYKLFDINKNYNLIKKGDKVLDLGCSPGSWLQVASKFTGAKGIVLGIDILPVKQIANVKFLQADITDPATLDLIKLVSKEFDVVISDLAPKTTGIKELDHEKSVYLNEKALEIAEKVLDEKGNFLCKIFQGYYSSEFIKKLRKRFEFVKSHKPESSRKESKEIYIIAKGFKQ